MLTKLCLTLAMTVSLGAGPPTTFTKQMLIDTAKTELSVQELSAIQRTKNIIEAAEILRSVYRSRVAYWEGRESYLDRVTNDSKVAIAYHRATGENPFTAYEAAGTQAEFFRDALDGISQSIIIWRSPRLKK